MDLYKVSYFVWGHPAFAIVSARSEDEAISYINRDYELEDNFHVRKVSFYDSKPGIKEKVFEP
ncbi:hypothetical protein [Salibacterium lacus]|uniref:Uncharacterized protein n=1 Tax=Salibacterium lacus TaxID=1898109 RepID=A0ABW5SWY1_9BACI